MTNDWWNKMPESVQTIHNALYGNNPDQKRLAEVGLKAISTLIRKNNDYGSAVWNEGKLAKNVPVGSKILVRLDDKFERCSQLLNGKEQMVQDEKVEDTMIDIVNYCLLYLARPDKPAKQLSYDQLLYHFQRETNTGKRYISCKCPPTCSEQCKGECGCEYHKYIFEQSQKPTEPPKSVLNQLEKGPQEGWM